MGNRDEASGDGYRFRGRGCIQLTGHSMYFHAGKALGADFVMEPDLVATPKYAALTAGWFWSTHNCNNLVDRHILLDCNTHCVVNCGSIRVNKEVLRIDRI